MAKSLLPSLTPRAFNRIGWLVFGVSTIVILSIWASYGNRFYDQVIPFYDSLSYQEGYLYTTQSIPVGNTLDRLTKVWSDSGNNVVLYKLFAALFSEVLPHSRSGLYVYLFGIHTIATLALFHTIKSLHGSNTLALASVAAWWATTPFGLLRDGIGDQRFDLSAGSFFLIVVICGLRWFEKPSLPNATLAGCSTALAMLHRPVMALLLSGVALVFFIVALTRHRKTARDWLLHVACAICPIAVVALPWLLTHFEFLRTYYLEYGVDQGRGTLGEATVFNFQCFFRSTGIVAAIILIASTGFGVTRYRVNRIRSLLVLIALLAPFSLMISFKATGNHFAAQMSLAIPMLSLACFSTLRSNRRPDTVLSIAASTLLLATVVGLSSFRLERSLATERPNARPEVEAVIRQIVAVYPKVTLGAFHDQPVNSSAFAAIARDLNIDLRGGFSAYHPYDFGLTADEAAARDPHRIHIAVTDTVAKLKQSSDLLILPTVGTQNRLWAGLFSHQMIPEIRRAVEADSSFTHFGRSAPVDGVEFDLYRITPDN